MTERFSLGETTRLYLDLVVAGVGQTGEAPTGTIQRRSDGKWFQASDGTWQSSPVENPMTETDATFLPGRYQIDFDQSTDTVEAATEYVANLTNAGTPVVLERRDLVYGPLARATTLGLCSVQGTILDMNGNPIQNVLVQATLLPVFSDTLGRAVESNEVRAYTNESGDFDLPLVIGITVRFTVESVGYDRRFVVPDQPSANFTDL